MSDSVWDTPLPPAAASRAAPQSVASLATSPPSTVGELAEALFGIFPATNAMADDRIGLQVGDPAAQVTRVGVALDPTAGVIDAAAALNCQAIVCHHPAYWIAPQEFVAAGEASLFGGAAAFRAARAGIAIIAMHTNLDAAPQAREMLLKPIGYRYNGPLWLTNGEKDAPLVARDPLVAVASIGQLAVPDTLSAAALASTFGAATPNTVSSSADSYVSALLSNEQCLFTPTLAELAERCVAAFGAVAKVWGDASSPVAHLAVCSGAGGEMLPSVVASQPDCFLTGELRHHEVIALSGLGIAVIELGHDLSELPYRAYLVEAMRELHFADPNIVMLEPSACWWAPHNFSTAPAGATTGTTTSEVITTAASMLANAPTNIDMNDSISASNSISRKNTVLSFADLEELTDV